MAENIQRFTVFLASPSDVETERKAVAAAVDEINRTFGEPEGFVLTLKRWETHTRPGRAPKGGSAQDVIDAQIGGYDIFVGLMWTRFGTPTKKAGSGTEQEYEAARRAGRRKRKHPLSVMFYFRSGTAKVKSIDPDQLKAVRLFKARVFEDHLAREYDTPKEFARLIREHLIHEARGLLGRKRAASTPDAPPTKPERPAAGRKRPEASAPKPDPKSSPKPGTKRVSVSGKRPRTRSTLLDVPTIPRPITDEDRAAFARKAFTVARAHFERAAADFNGKHTHLHLRSRRPSAEACTLELLEREKRRALVRVRTLDSGPYSFPSIVYETGRSFWEDDADPVFSQEARVRVNEAGGALRYETYDGTFERGAHTTPSPQAVARFFWARFKLLLAQRPA